MPLAPLAQAWVAGNYRVLVPLTKIGLVVLVATLCLVVGDVGMDISEQQDPPTGRPTHDLLDVHGIFAAAAMLLGSFSGHVMMPSLRASMQ